MPNKFSRIWHELKRRSVHRLMAIYAGSAYVIFEASTLIFPRWGFPDWTIDLVLYLLILGAIVTFVMGWIYDLTPDGIQKTGPVSETTTNEGSPTPNGWKIASYISLVVIVGLIILNIIPRTGKKEILDKSIAVLPFKYLSEDTDKQYLADGVMDEILLNLSKIRDIRVLARTSVEQYRETEKTASEICQELDISYLLEGSFLKNGDQVRLIVQLIEPGKEGHVWAKKYDRSWQDILEVQSEVARLVAGELQALIVPLEEELIYKTLTNNPAAYDIYLKANAHRTEFIDTWDQTSYEIAIGLYNAALEIDTSFARVYTALAHVFYYRWFQDDTYSEEDLLDTVLILTNKALSYDFNLDEAYYLRALYHRQKGDYEKALSDYNKALNINRNYSTVYISKGYLLTWLLKDYIQGIVHFEKALTLVYGEDRPELLGDLGRAYLEIGILEKAISVYKEKLDLDADSLAYYNSLATLEFGQGNFEEAYHHAKNTLTGDDSDFIDPAYLMCLPPRYKDEQYENTLKLIDWFDKLNRVPRQSAHRFGYSFYLVGKEEEANQYFNLQIEYSQESIKLGRSLSQWRAAQYDLAGTYAFLGQKEKAYEYLAEFGKMEKFPLWWVSLFRNDPLFDSIRDEPEFQQILLDVEAKYQAEHERVRNWLETNNML